MAGDRLIATYLIETAHPLEHGAKVIAGEQSCGTFIRVAGETDELRAAHGARIESVEDLGPVEKPSLHGSKPPKGVTNPQYRRGRIVLSWPIENMGPILANVVATVMGNLYELQEFSGLKLLDLELPPAFASAYQGPQFGIEGTKKLAGVAGRPIVGTIVKPSVGLSPEQTGELVKVLCEAGLDFIKDDELQANGPHSPFDARVEHVMRAINDHAQKTGKKVMYAFNLTDEVDEMRRHHDKVLAAGGTCIMLSVNSLGTSAVAHVRKHSQLPIHAHRNGWGMFTRSPVLGVEYVAYQKLWRIAGIDHFHCNGLRNKFWEPDESVIRSARALMTPLWPGKPWTAMPVLSSAQWAGQAPDTYRALQTTDVMYLCGGGIFGHPAGISAGVKSVIQSWEAALAGRTLEDYAKDHPELKQALGQYKH